ncbi:MAG: Mrp/NBP35 family ATP-binding protein [Alphaproteobacteria bacterium]|jgi:ATP-binding protein involved in chromosome partitioning|nr:Mrp/NBP35 family ATP-binding protein [Alphaproteobacteria bacterium]MDP7428318.1 Mrp/NBP35 family ATP-binding protein [Alphaproteobacteria bacterium]
MVTVTEEQILAALGAIDDADQGGDVVGLGMIGGLQIRDGHVAFAIEVAPEDGAAKEPLRQLCEKTVHALPGVLSVSAVLTAHRAAAPAPAVAAGPGGPRPAPQSLPGVTSIVAVASGKGGVGKSTTAVNLALGMAAEGRAVGILDADIYGPSIPRMLGIGGQPLSPDGSYLLPMQNHGVVCMSMGFLVPDDTATIWRGPMVMSALEQLLRDVKWGELDVLVVDLPPGTGDAHLTMAQRVPLSGAVIVSTPQDVALADARKGISMFEKVDVPVLGLIENMSFFVCPHCDERSEIFSHGGARREAERLGVEFLGEIPISLGIRETSDAGTPIVVHDPDCAEAQAFLTIARRLGEKIVAAEQESASQAPRIVVQ